MFVINPEGEVIDGRTHYWQSRPGMTSDDLLVVRATIPPGGCHDFHRHPNKEEVISVTAGEGEMWVGEEKATLRAGDSAYIPHGEAHATFNRGTETLDFIAIITPCSAPGGMVEELAEEEPWKSLGK